MSFQTRDEWTSFIRATRAAACLVALALTSQVSFAQTAPTIDVMARAATSSLHAVDLTQQLSAQRQFVSDISAMQQDNLRRVVSADGGLMREQSWSRGAPGLFAIRIGEFAQTQGALVADYSQSIRQRRLDMAEGVIDLADDRTLLFLETGFMLAAPDISVRAPLPPLLGVNVSFLDFALPRGGFFARSGN